MWKDIIISLLSLFWDESGSFSLKFVSSLSRISTKCESIPAYKTYLHVTGIILHFSELSRCIWKLNWSDSRSPSCFWLIELCERNKNLDPPLIFLLIENTLRIVHLLIPANWVDIGSTSQFLLIKLINIDPLHILCWISTDVLSGELIGLDWNVLLQKLLCIVYTVHTVYTRQHSACMQRTLISLCW